MDKLSMKSTKSAPTIRSNYVKRMRDNYVLIINTLMHDLIVSIDKEGIIDFVNDATAKFLGKPRKKIVGTHFIEYIHPDDAKKTVFALQKAIDNKDQVRGFVVRMKTPKGNRSVAWNGVPVFDDSGNHIGAQATGKDLTELLQKENELKQSKQQLNTLLEVMVDPIVIVDINGWIIEVSQSAQDALGFQKMELVGNNFLDLNTVTKKSKLLMAKNLEKIKKGIYVEPHLIEAVTKSGQIQRYEMSTTRIFYKDKHAILAIFHNVTEQKEAEEKLQASEQRFKNLVENAPDAIWLQDLNGTFVDGNKMAEAITGYPKEELIGKNILDVQLVSEKYIPQVLEAFNLNKLGKRSGPTELGLVRKDKSLVFIEASSFPVQSNEKIEVIGIARDITDRKEVEEALNREREMLEVVTTNVNAGLAVISKDYQILWANKVLTGYLGDVEEKTCYSAIHKISGVCPDCGVKEVFETGKNFVIHQKEVSTPVGKIWLDITTTAIRDEKGEIVAASEMSVDITKRKQLENELKESLHKFRTIFEGATEGIIAVDPETAKFVFANPFMFEITGYTPNELIQLSIPEIVPKEDLQYLIEQLSKHSKKKVALTKDIPIVRKDKRIVYCDATSKLMKIGNNEFVVGFLRDVTEQKKAEKQIKELAKFPAENPTPVLRISKDNSILYANKPAETFMENLKQTKSQSLPILLKESVQGSLKSGSSVIVENDYTDRIYSFVVTPVIEEDYVNVYGRDITEQKKAEDALMASIEKYRELINGMNDTALVLDFEGKIIDANKTAVEVLGYSKEELLSSTPQLFDATLKPEAIRNLVEQMKTHSLLVFETTHRTKKGKVFPVEISTSRVMYNGKPAILSIARDITERKKADEALRESEEKYRTIINSMNDSAWIIDFDENIIDANEAAIKMLGYSKEELLSMKPRDFDENISDKQAQTLVHKVKAGEKYVFETLHTAKSGKKIPVELSTSFIMYQGKPAVLSIARDITERKKAQLALNATMHLLQQSNQELESYTYVVSHDLKAPLRTLRSFGSFILEDYADKLDETGKDYLNRMINAAAHMDTLIEDLLVLSRVGRKYTEFEQTDLNQVLAEIQSDIEMTIKERHAKIVVDKLPVLLVQRVWIKQLFMNLMNNALKFNESEMPTVKISYQETDVDHLFKVQDNGIGIDEKYHKRIFNLFERAPTEKKYEGTGAGLSICKKIVEQLGGKIWVESTVGKGSTFMFNIPKERKKSGENEHDEQK